MKGSEMKVIFTTMDASWEGDFLKKNKKNKGHMGVVEGCHGYWGRDNDYHDYCGHCIDE
jgi:hypothetical protein